MYDNNWSIRRLSDESQLPYESVKKLLSGKIANPSIYSLYKIGKALNCGIDYLLDSEMHGILNCYDLPERAVILLKEMAAFEHYLHKQNQHNVTRSIPVFVPTGTVKDGMFFDSISTETIDIPIYHNELDDIIMCGVRIDVKELHPTYLCGDILLIAKDRFPYDGDICIFLMDNKVYIRKYSMGYPTVMKSVNDSSNPIIVNDINHIHFFGRVVSILRK
jgi:SOS-response transcriptional repressor LexA